MFELFGYKTDAKSYIRRSRWGHIRSAFLQVVVIVLSVVIVLAVPVFTTRFISVFCVLAPALILWVIWSFHRNWRGAKIDADMLRYFDEKPKRVGADGELEDPYEEFPIETDQKRHW